MRSAVQVLGAGTRWWDVSKETEADTGSERAMANRVKIICWKNVGTEASIRTERAKTDGAKTIGWTGIADGGGGGSSVGEGTEVTYGQAYRQRQGECGDTGLYSGGVTLIKS